MSQCRFCNSDYSEPAYGPPDQNDEISRFDGLGRIAKFVAALFQNDPNFDKNSREKIAEAWERRRKREGMHSILRQLIYAGLLPEAVGVRDCRVRAIPPKRYGRPTGFSGMVELRRFSGKRVDEIMHAYHGTRLCKSLGICPECAAEFGRIIREILMEAVERLLVQGYHCFMLTLTAQHSRGMRLMELSDGFQTAKRWAEQQREWRKIKAELGIIGTISSLEVTDDDPDTPPERMTGFHWHQHVLIFYRPVGFCGWFSDETAHGIELRIGVLWQRALKRHGLNCSLEHGVDVTLPRRVDIERLQDLQAAPVNDVVDVDDVRAMLAGRPMARRLAERVDEGSLPDWMRVSVRGLMADHVVEWREARARQAAAASASVYSLQSVAKYVSKGLVFELSGNINQTKTGRKRERISMWEMLERIAAGDTRLIPRYGEYMDAIRGRSLVRWSQGLRRFCAMPRDEEDALKDVCEAGDVIVYDWTAEDFKPVAKNAQQTNIVEVADRAHKAGKDAGTAVAAAMRVLSAGYDIRTGAELSPGMLITPEMRASARTDKAAAAEHFAAKAEAAAEIAAERAAKAVAKDEAAKVAAEKAAERATKEIAKAGKAKAKAGAKAVKAASMTGPKARARAEGVAIRAAERAAKAAEKAAKAIEKAEAKAARAVKRAKLAAAKEAARVVTSEAAINARTRAGLARKAAARMDAAADAEAMRERVAKGYADLVARKAEEARLEAERKAAEERELTRGAVFDIVLGTAAPNGRRWTSFARSGKFSYLALEAMSNPTARLIVYADGSWKAIGTSERRSVDICRGDEAVRELFEKPRWFLTEGQYRAAMTPYGRGQPLKVQPLSLFDAAP